MDQIREQSQLVEQQEKREGARIASGFEALLIAEDEGRPPQAAFWTSSDLSSHCREQ